jgi:hypothetical protein
MIVSKTDKIELEKIANKHNIDIEEVKAVIDSIYGFMREKIAEINFSEKELTKEEFSNLKTNFNIPCIGKFVAVYYAYKKINKIK